MDTGLGWDEVNQTDTCSNWKWEEYFKANEDMRALKNGLPNYDLYYSIFGSSLVTGNFVVPSTDPYLNQTSEGDGDSSGEDDIDASTMDIGPHFGEKRAGLSQSRKKNKKKGKARIDWQVHGLLSRRE